MKEFKGTPGPWFVGRRNDAWGLHVTNGSHNIVTFRGKRVKTQVDGLCNIVAPKHEDEKIANAHLIAAAPELLDALQEVVAISDRKHDAWDRAHAAIAKALGEEQ